MSDPRPQGWWQIYNHVPPCSAKGHDWLHDTFQATMNMGQGIAFVVYLKLTRLSPKCFANVNPFDFHPSLGKRETFCHLHFTEQAIKAVNVKGGVPELISPKGYLRLSHALSELRVSILSTTSLSQKGTLDRSNTWTLQL